MPLPESANIPDRPPEDHANDPVLTAQGKAAPMQIESFSARGLSLDVVLIQTGDQDPSRPLSPGEEPYPIHCHHRYAALARNPATGEVLGVLEFYSMPANPFDLTQPGKKLIEKALSVDKNHLRRGIGYNLFVTVLRAGYRVIPSGCFTTAGLALARKLEANGITLAIGTDVTTTPLP